MPQLSRRSFGALSLLTLLPDMLPAAETPEPAYSYLGMNLSGLSDWNSELPFVDLFHLSRTWISQQQGQPWGKGPPLDLDAHGWIKSLQPNCSAETPLCTGLENHYPAGAYTVLYEGEGKLGISLGNPKIISDQPGKLVFQPDVAKGGFFLRISRTLATNPIRNIRVLMPGFEASYAKQVFHPAFLDRWHGMNTLRFMDWMNTNGSKVRSWADRPTPADATWTAKGAPVEVMVDLANRLDANAWFCMPHLADDGYIRNFAVYVRDHLKTSVKAYIEYSNEVWNSMFAQTRYAGERGVELKLAEKPWEAGWKYYSKRSMEIFDIWEQVFGGRQRLVRVIASQCVPYVSEMKMAFGDTAKKADALAIAPYLGFSIPAKADKPGRLDAETVSKWTVEQLLDHVEQKVLPESIKQMRDQKAVAEKYAVRLIAYEAGQHLVGIGGGENNEAMTRLFHAANRHARMGEIYGKYYDAWKESGGELMCVFASAGKWSKWGSWGVCEYGDESEAQQPKLKATLDWNRRHRMRP